jgi:hypothetical protein
MQQQIAADLYSTGALVNHNSLFGDRILLFRSMVRFMTGIQRQYLSYQNYSIAATETSALSNSFYNIYAIKSDN